MPKKLFTTENQPKTHSKVRPDVKQLILDATDGGKLMINSLIGIVEAKKTSDTNKINANKVLAAYAFGQPKTEIDNNFTGNMTIGWLNSPQLLPDNSTLQVESTDIIPEKTQEPTEK